MKELVRLYRDQLFEIAGNENYIISDNSISSRTDQWFKTYIWDKRRFRNLDVSALENQELFAKVFNDFILLDNVFVTPKVVLEFKYFRKLIRDKIVFMDENEKQREVYNESRQSLLNEKVKRGKESIEDLYLILSKIYRNLKQSLFIPSLEPTYKNLEERALGVAKKPGVKINYTLLRYGNYKKDEDLHTDEEIAASAFYNSLVNHSSTSIITSDSDIMKIVRNMARKFSRMETFGGFEIESLMNHPVKVYFFNGERFRLRFDSSYSFHLLLNDKNQFLDEVV